eukprot:TRINITY_DN33965_c0_g1_i3.p1 TRINITY_DN33965_c0_g1~~TRINITY_DN33965_c0_g1_i3.p1  ORF type:complete len:136 (+),score=22.81 TRINITY_DN33965_c0_g1_i3:584-991(+)
MDQMKDVIADSFKLPRSSVEIDDGFVVKYEQGSQASLKMHRDGSIVSGIVSLSRGEDYEGGGTRFNDDGVRYRPDRGSGVLFAGQRLHGGVEVKRGTRFILTMFFTCGNLSARELAVSRDEEAASARGGYLDVEA